MVATAPLHKILASDDPAERRDGLLQLAILLGDRISQLEAAKRQVDLAVQLMDRHHGKGQPDGRRIPKSHHVSSTQSAIKSIEALVGSP